MSTTIYQHPLAYLLGLEGIALLRGWAGDEDESFTRHRLADVRRLLDDPRLAEHPGVTVRQGTAVEGYRAWAPTYDGPNGLFAMDEPFVWGIVDGLRPGDALDAACGTDDEADAPIPDPGSWNGWPWTLLDLVPRAASTSVWRIPFTLNWHFRLDA